MARNGKEQSTEHRNSKQIYAGYRGIAQWIGCGNRTHHRQKYVQIKENQKKWLSIISNKNGC